MFSIDPFVRTLNNPSDFRRKSFPIPGTEEPAGSILYFTSLVDRELLERILLDVLRTAEGADPQEGYEAGIRLLSAIGSRVELRSEELAAKLYTGHCLFLLDGESEAIAVCIPARQNRAITPPETESSLIGPRDAFVEDLQINLSLIRTRLRDEKLIVKSFVVGTRTRTEVILLYLAEIAERQVLEKVESGLNRMKIDGVTDTSQIGQLLLEKTKWTSPFPIIQTTERPDKAVAAILEGRFVLLMSNSPTGLVLPITLTALYQTADDYYFPFLSGSFLRFIRMIGLIMTLYLPALYVSITTLNQDVLRIQFMLAVAASREGVPYPAYIEVSMMAILLELINEASVRLPRVIGGTATIVGGLIIGTAAAQAHLISNIMIVVTAATAIGSFTTPNYMVGIALRMWSYLLIILSVPFGLYGMVLGTAVLFLYLCQLKSFGVSYLSPFDTFRYGDLFRDALFRAPIQKRKKLPATYRQKSRAVRRFDPKEGENRL
ncbi:spore germination protein [Cohnella zeiphila]|uniref:Spore germination protein n=1 Tax=Cohnella zeiphila TaxID=2761120 RepID=A0A7X0VWS7_9BACL|nr:spore germination protein [Cohnella zeiphila]MBB6733281.1 spore germination protein [Cohnella zeiphila]